MIDGIDQLISLYGQQDDFARAFIENTLFLPVEIVDKRNQKMIELYKSKGKFPIRYSSSYNQALKINNKAEGIICTKDRDSRLPKYPSFNIKIDNDGNCENRSLIKLYLNQTIGAGKSSTIKNYIISHVWGLASHPLFFSALWNIVLIPAHFNYLMDKNPESHEVVRLIKNLIQKQCIALYKPYESLVSDIPDIEEFKELLCIDSATQEKDKYKVHFITQDGIERQKEKILVSNDERDLLKQLLRKMGQKFFVDHYESYMNEEDLMNVVPTGIYTYKSLKTRISTMRKIFREGLNFKALAYISNNSNSKLKDQSTDLAKKLLDSI
jgi:hypothetical protein